MTAWIRLASWMATCSTAIQNMRRLLLRDKKYDRYRQRQTDIYTQTHIKTCQKESFYGILQSPVKIFVHTIYFHRNQKRKQRAVAANLNSSGFLMIKKSEHLYKSIHFGSLLVWRIQVQNPTIFPGVDVPKNPRVKFQTLQAPVSKLNAKVGP